METVEIELIDQTHRCELCKSLNNLVSRYDDVYQRYLENRNQYPSPPINSYAGNKIHVKFSIFMHSLFIPMKELESLNGFFYCATCGGVTRHILMMLKPRIKTIKKHVQP